jgi:dihydrodipicolinate synthase/N-acetylneuraminate lyase
MKFQGSFPAIITPYSEDHQINFDEFKNLLKMHMHYSDGIVLCGSTGEGWLLSLEERSRLLMHTQASFSKPIIVSTPVWSVKDFKETLHALEPNLHAVTAILLSAPSYLKLNEDQVLNFFESCASLSPVPIIAYHIPSRNNIIFTPAIMNFLSQHPQIIGIKETRWSHIEQYHHLPNLIQFAGDDEFLKSPLIKASINVGGNIFPELFSKQLSTFPWDEWQKLLNLANNPMIIKFLMQNQGLISCSHARDPLIHLSKRIQHEAQVLFDEILSIIASTLSNKEVFLVKTFST